MGGGGGAENDNLRAWYTGEDTGFRKGAGGGGGGPGKLCNSPPPFMKFFFGGLTPRTPPPPCIRPWYITTVLYDLYVILLYFIDNQFMVCNAL